MDESQIPTNEPVDAPEEEITPTPEAAPEVPAEAPEAAAPEAAAETPVADPAPEAPAEEPEVPAEPVDEPPVEGGVKLSDSVVSSQGLSTSDATLVEKGEVESTVNVDGKDIVVGNEEIS